MQRVACTCRDRRKHQLNTQPKSSTPPLATPKTTRPDPRFCRSGSFDRARAQPTLSTLTIRTMRRQQSMSYVDSLLTSTHQRQVRHDRREQAGDAFCELAHKLGVPIERADAWFDDGRRRWSG